MDIRSLQTALNARGAKPPVVADGIAGKRTMAAVEAALSGQAIGGWERWTDARMRVAAEQLVYRDLKIDVGKIDGMVGPQTSYAREMFVARSKGKAAELEAWRDKVYAQPETSKPPASITRWPRQRDMVSFFGAPGSNHVQVTLPFSMIIAWDTDSKITHFTCNAKIKEPLERIFERTLDFYTELEVRRLRLDRFGGCFNNRKMRGGSSLSTHACAVAVDIDPERNQYRWGADRATLDGAEYMKFWEFVADEGALSLGRARNIDWMHFQFCNL